MRDKNFWRFTLLFLVMGSLASCQSPTLAPAVKPGTPVQIIGRVTRPGTCPHQPGLTLAEALENGGQVFASFANMHRIRIYSRKASVQAQFNPAQQDAASLLDSGSLTLRAIINLEKQPDFLLLPGDVVVVPEKMPIY